MILIILIHIVQLYTIQVQLYVLQIIGELHMKMCVAVQIGRCADRQNEGSKSVIVQLRPEVMYRRDSEFFHWSGTT
jgi:hypothetical protein